MDTWTVCHTEPIFIRSSWRSQKPVTESSCQTEVGVSVEKAIQYSNSKSVDCQTTSTRPSSCRYDADKLAAFLESNMELIQSEIRQSVQYGLRCGLWEKHWLAVEGGIKTHLRLNSADLQSQFEQKSDIKYIVSSVSWNCSQTCLIIAYRAKIHNDWCNHESWLALWNLYLPKKPTILEIDGCISLIESHPQQSSLFALGTYSGKIQLLNTRYVDWDATRDSYIQAMSPNHPDVHQETITGLTWRRLRKQWLLVSLSLDGKILLWKYNEEERLISVLSAFIILMADLPKSLGLRSNAQLEAEVAITRHAFNPEEDDCLMVGCEGGALFYCSLESDALAKYHRPDDDELYQSKIVFKNPIKLSYAPHRAHITSVHFSPAEPRYFLTAGLDYEIRVYQLHNTKPIHIIHCQNNFLSVRWLNTLTVFIGVHETGKISQYHIQPAKYRLMQTFELDSQVSSIVINSYHPDNHAAFICANNEVYLLEFNTTTE